MLLVNLSKAERYALHKLLVTEDRPSAFAVNSERDRHQAVQLMQVLLERGASGLDEACRDLARRGAGCVKKARQSLKKCTRLDAAVVGEFEADHGSALAAPKGR